MKYLIKVSIMDVNGIYRDSYLRKSIYGTYHSAKIHNANRYATKKMVEEVISSQAFLRIEGANLHISAKYCVIQEFYDREDIIVIAHKSRRI